MRSEREIIDAVLGTRRVALVGASRRPKHFSRAVMKELATRGYEVEPVNPAGGEIDGRPVAPSVAALDEPPEAAIALVPDDRVSAVLADCRRAGVGAVWFFRRLPAGTEVPEGLEVVSGRCPLMFLEGSGGVHAFHRFLLRLFGRFPHPVAG